VSVKVYVVKQLVVTVVVQAGVLALLVSDHVNTMEVAACAKGENPQRKRRARITLRMELPR
jgi:hypothetical protein